MGTRPQHRPSQFLNPRQPGRTRIEPAGQELDPGQQAELTDLRHHWDTAYDIGVNRDTWTAEHLEDPDPEKLTALTAEGLRTLIRADYDRRTLRELVRLNCES